MAQLFVPDVDIYADYVVIENVTIFRPARLSASQWLEFWEQLVEDKKFHPNEYLTR